MPRVAHPAPSDSSQDPRYTVERYLALFDEGVLDRDDRVELLEGVVVAIPPSNPPHAAAISRIMRALFEAIGRRAVIRVQSCPGTSPTTTRRIRGRLSCWSRSRSGRSPRTA